MSEHSETNTQFAQANFHMREGRHAEALKLYLEIPQASDPLQRHININIKICKSKINNPDALGEISLPAIPHGNDDSGAMKKIRINNLAPLYKGHIDAQDDNFIHGWIYDANNPEDTVCLDLYVGEMLVSTTKANLQRADVKAAGEMKANCGFHLNYGNHVSLKNFNKLRIFISETKTPAFPQTLITNPLIPQMEGLTAVAQLVKRELLRKNDSRLHWVSSALIPMLMEKTRLTIGDNLVTEVGNCEYLRKLGGTGIVDVIIPVYEGYEETINCIKSVLATKNSHPYRLFVINDYSPNKLLGTALRELEKLHNFTLFENESNLGFVGTVNRGMSQSDDNDVVLLNSDTITPNYWLDQLVEAAYTDPIIGTATPFSNNATICSYPNFCQDNEIFADLDVDSLNRITYEANGTRVIDIPTAHGFCMFIKRAVLDEVGLFDTQKWGKGYAEENDFSLRAEKHGWRNVLAAGTFVQHLGSVSFSSNTEEFIRKNLKILNGIYPDYAARVSQFIKDDPVLALRNNISKNVLKANKTQLVTNKKIPGSYVLFISLAIGGGTQVATSTLSEALKKENAHVIYLTSPRKNIWRLSAKDPNLYIDYDCIEDFDELVADLKSLAVWHVHFHSSLEFSKEIWSLPDYLECEFDVTIHDYLTVCPRVNLIGGNRTYCGEPKTDICDTCIDINGTHESAHINIKDLGASVKDWRDFHKSQLLKARKIFAPSKDAATRINRYFPELIIEFKPHPEPVTKVNSPRPTADHIKHVVFLGAIGVHKGFDYLIGCAKYSEMHSLPIKFHVVGYTSDDVIAAAHPNIIIHGKYDREDLPGILNLIKPDMVAILSVWPETFSYTFSEAQANGLRVLTFDFGAPSERIKNGSGKTIPAGATYKTVCDAILDFDNSTRMKIVNGKTYPQILVNYYGFDLKTAKKNPNTDRRI